MEKVNKGISNIVVVGSWNKSILSPEWVKEYLLNEYDNFEVAYPISGIGSLKFTTTDFSFLIIDGKLQFELCRYDEDAMKALSRTAGKIFRLLGHTPVTAMGINFVYRSEGTDIPSISTKDNDKLMNILGSSVSSQEYQRVFTFSETERLILSISCENSIITFSFNFDYRYSKVSELLNVLGDDDNILLRTQERADEIINEVYQNVN